MNEIPLTPILNGNRLVMTPELDQHLLQMLHTTVPDSEVADTIPAIIKQYGTWDMLADVPYLYVALPTPYAETFRHYFALLDIPSELKHDNRTLWAFFEGEAATWVINRLGLPSSGGHFQ